MLRGHSLTGDASIAGVISAKPVAIAIAPASGRIAYGTGETIADRARLASAGLTTLSGLATLATLTALAALLARLALLLARLALLPRLAGLTGLSVAGELAGLSAEAGELVAETGQIVHGPVER